MSFDASKSFNPFFFTAAFTVFTPSPTVVYIELLAIEVQCSNVISLLEGTSILYEKVCSTSIHCVPPNIFVAGTPLLYITLTE